MRRHRPGVGSHRGWHVARGGGQRSSAPRARLRSLPIRFGASSPDRPGGCRLSPASAESDKPSSPISSGRSSHPRMGLDPASFYGQLDSLGIGRVNSAGS